jgi:branched-chain amino acid transport system substrate-binding protein
MNTKTLKILGSTALILGLLAFSYVFWFGARPDSERPVLRIGVILPLTGEASYIGDAIRNGMELARIEFDERSDSPPPFDLRLHFVDTGGETGRVVTAYHDLVRTRNAQALIPVQHGIRALIPLVERDRRVLLATSVPDNDIVEQNPWTFRFFINAESDASTIAAYARQQLGLQRAATIYVNDDMGISYNDSFARHFTRLGGEIVHQETYSPATASFRTQVLRIQRAAPDAIYLIGYGRNMANIPIQLREAGVDATILSVGTISQPEIMEAGGSALDGIYYTTSEFFTFAPETEQLAAFVDRYQERHGEVPVFFEVFGYDAVRLLVMAAERRGVQADELRAGLTEIQGARMAVGEVRVDPQGDVQFPVVVRTIRDGQWAPVN